MFIWTTCFHQSSCSIFGGKGTFTAINMFTAKGESCPPLPVHTFPHIDEMFCKFRPYVPSGSDVHNSCTERVCSYMIKLGGPWEAKTGLLSCKLYGSRQIIDSSGPSVLICRMTTATPTIKLCYRLGLQLVSGKGTDYIFQIWAKLIIGYVSLACKARINIHLISL